MNRTTVESFIQTLNQSGLLEGEQSGELEHALRKQFQDPRALAKNLVQRGWLTPFQANCLLQGRAGELTLGNFVLLDKLGEGGMGQVFKARHRRLGRIVAIKVIRKERLTGTDAIRRFHREIQAAAQLRHANVVLAYDADHQGDTHFFAMEYVEGTDLSQLIRKNGPMPIAQACDCTRQAALGLQHAFEHGLVHRDIKPANILLTGNGAVKILDMGLARLTARAEETLSRLTVIGSVMGTPDYIAPEQAMNSHDVDIRADLYSLGCTFYFLLTGKVPFPGGGLTDKLLKHQLQEPEAVEQLRPEVPAPVARIVRKLMAKKLAERYQTPAELAVALADLTVPSSSSSDATIDMPAETTLAVAAARAPADPWSDLMDTEPASRAATTPAARPPATGFVSRAMLRWVLAGAGALVVLIASILIFRPSGETVPTKQVNRPSGPKKVKPATPTVNQGGPIISGTSAEDQGTLPADADFVFQGEYAAAESTLAAQMVAQGQGSFFVQFLRGGLPGNGWDGSAPVKIDPIAADGTLIWDQDGWTGKLSGGQLSGQTPAEAFKLAKATRRSPTLGAKPDPGAVVLFDGSSTDEWQNGKIENGLLAAGAVTTRKFKDFRLHLEFQVPFQPQQRGQARGNSGVYLQDRYELQILDSFGLPPSKVDCGAIYGLVPPSRNMSLPPLSWQTYDIDFTAARYDAKGTATKNAEVTVQHNGTTIHDRQSLSGSTFGAQPETDTPGPIFLQYHGGPIYFRNIWIVEKN